MNADQSWEYDRERPAEEALLIDVDGFEGPLDLLLALAREQKVDLARISILALVDQYLAFIGQARRLRIEVAADYLVMAAWLAYLKSRLLLPEVEGEIDDEPSGAELAAALARRMRRLEAMRDVAARLMARPRLGLDVFARGAPEPLAAARRLRWNASLYDLLDAYAAQQRRSLRSLVRIARRRVFSLKEARERLARLIGGDCRWQALDALLIDHLAQPDLRATARASALCAGLDLVKEGAAEMRQAAPFATLYVRSRPAGSVGADEAHG